MSICVTDMCKLYKYPVIGNIALKVNRLLGVEIPRTVKFGKNVTFPHNSIGTVLHNNTVIEDNVKIYQNVTFGRADIYKSSKNEEFEGFVVKKGACICAGAKILCKKGTLVIGENAVVAANAVLLNSIGPGEIWGGSSKINKPPQ